jgi:histone H3/H4
MPRASQPAKKASPSKKGSGKKHHKKVSIKGLGRYEHYIQKINKAKNGKLRISGAAVTVIDQMIHYAIEKLMHSANEVRLSSEKATLSGKHVKGAFTLLRHTAQLENGHDLTNILVRVGDIAYEKYKSGKNLAVNQGKRAHEFCDLGIPVSRVKAEMKLRSAGCGCRMDASAPVYMAAAVDALVSILVLASGRAAIDNKRKIISTVHLKLALRKHAQLDRFYDKFVFTSGVQPHIHKALLPAAKKASKPRKARKPTKSSK